MLRLSPDFLGHDLRTRKIQFRIRLFSKKLATQNPRDHGVSLIVQMNPIAGKRDLLFRVGCQTRRKEVHKASASFRTDFTHDPHVSPGLCISSACLRIIWMLEVLGRNRRENDQGSSGVAAFHFPQITLKVLPESADSRLPRKGLIESKTENHHIGRPTFEEFSEVITVTLGPQTVAHLIPRPC